MNEIIFRFFNNLAGQSALGDRVIIFFAEYLGWLILIILVALVVWSWRRVFNIASVSFVLASTLTAWLIAQIIKYFYFSPRPFLALTDIYQLIRHGANDSFPSGHAALFMAL